MNLDQIGRMLQRLEARLERVENAQRLSHASLDNTSLEVRDAAGGLRGLLGVQGDGTVAVNVVNGPIPPAPSTPTVQPALAALEITWDGLFADGQVAPLDWQRVEVHVGPVTAFVPDQGTLRGTIESPQGGTVTVPLPYTEWYVRLRSRTTSGVASAATDTVAATPRKADTQDLTAGAVTADTIAVDALTGKSITGGTITGALVQTAAAGQRITLNESGANKILVYNSSGTVIGELSAQGLLVQGANGAMLVMDPNDAFPNLRLTNAERTNSAVINVSSNNAVLGLNSGAFAAEGTTWKWRTLFGQHNDGNEYWAVERVQDIDNSVNKGGHIRLSPSTATFGYYTSADPSQGAWLYISQGFAQLTQCRLEIVPPASSASALYVGAKSGHTGNLIRARLDTAEKFAVDKDGNTAVAGNATISGSATIAGDTTITGTATIAGRLSARNIASGRITITPSAANTPTSGNVTGLNMVGTPRVSVSPATTVPGTQVTGVGFGNVTTNGFVVWLTRINTTSTGIDWTAIAE